MKFCSSCGAQIEDNAVFCSSCGKKVGQIAEKKKIESKLKCIVQHKTGVVEVYTDCIVVKKKGEFFAMRPASEKKYLFSMIKSIEKHRKQFLTGAFIHFDMGEGRAPDGSVLFDYAVEFKNNDDLEEAYIKIEAEYNRYNNL